MLELCRGQVRYGGQVCKFTHRKLSAAEEKQRQEALAKRSGSPAAPAAKTYAKELCSAWLKGDCPEGKKCPLAHPKKMKGSQPS